MVFRVYRTSTFLTGHRPENKKSVLELRERVDGKASIENWFIKFTTTKQIVKFMQEHGRIIIKPPTYKDTAGDIEIYDCDRELMYIDEVIN